MALHLEPVRDHVASARVVANGIQRCLSHLCKPFGVDPVSANGCSILEHQERNAHFVTIVWWNGVNDVWVIQYSAHGHLIKGMVREIYDQKLPVRLGLNRGIVPDSKFNICQDGAGY